MGLATEPGHPGHRPDIHRADQAVMCVSKIPDGSPCVMVGTRPDVPSLPNLGGALPLRASEGPSTDHPILYRVSWILRGGGLLRDVREVRPGQHGGELPAVSLLKAYDAAGKSCGVGRRLSKDYGRSGDLQQGLDRHRGGACQRLAAVRAV